jgi:hypothetical protein
MTDEQHDADPPAGDGRDPYLEALVSAANTYGLSFDVTLHVSGVIVSGRLISGAVFFRQLAETLRGITSGADAPEGAEATREMLAGIYDAAAEVFEDQVEREQTKDSDTGGQRLGAAVAHIHLRDAAIWTPGAGGALPSGLWRGRLSHVSGWSHGALAYHE